MSIANKKKMLSLLLATTMAVSTAGCKAQEQNDNNEVATTIEQNDGQVTENESVYDANDIYVVAAETLSGKEITYLARQGIHFIQLPTYYELKTNCIIDKINKVTNLVDYLEADEIKQNYNETEIMELYSSITEYKSTNYPVSTYENDIIDNQAEQIKYDANSLNFCIKRDSNGRKELYIVKSYIGALQPQEYDFFTNVNITNQDILSISSLCEFIPLDERRKSYTEDELRVLLENARKIYHGDKSVNTSFSLNPRTDKEKFKEEQILVLDTSKLDNFGTDDSKKYHILLLTSNENDTCFHYNELGSNVEAACLLVDEEGYSLGYYVEEGPCYITFSDSKNRELLPLNEFLTTNGYNDYVKNSSFTFEELYDLEYNLDNQKRIALTSN